jgi:hypothetical protein
MAKYLDLPNDIVKSGAHTSMYTSSRGVATLFVLDLGIGFFACLNILKLSTSRLYKSIKWKFKCKT